VDSRLRIVPFRTGHAGYTNPPGPRPEGRGVGTAVRRERLPTATSKDYTPHFGNALDALIVSSVRI